MGSAILCRRSAGNPDPAGGRRDNHVEFASAFILKAHRAGRAGCAERRDGKAAHPAVKGKIVHGVRYARGKLDRLLFRGQQEAVIARLPAEFHARAFAFRYRHLPGETHIRSQAPDGRFKPPFFLQAAHRGQSYGQQNGEEGQDNDYLQ